MFNVNFIKNIISQFNTLIVDNIYYNQTMYYLDRNLMIAFIILPVYSVVNLLWKNLI